MNDPNAINYLIGRFTDLHEDWENNPEGFEWQQLDDLAKEGSQAYNEGAGPSFHALALDGIRHNAFHEHFLTVSLQSGFDPFKLAQAGSEANSLPVIDHHGLAEEAQSNSSSARMHALLADAARRKFEAWADHPVSGELLPVIEACAESIPPELLQRLAPDLVKSPASRGNMHGYDPLEGYLTPAEMISENSSSKYG